MPVSYRAEHSKFNRSALRAISNRNPPDVNVGLHESTAQTRFHDLSPNFILY
jgi:hypothetical protein